MGTQNTNACKMNIITQENNHEKNVVKHHGFMLLIAELVKISGCLCRWLLLIFLYFSSFWFNLILHLIFDHFPGGGPVEGAGLPPLKGGE